MLSQDMLTILVSSVVCLLLLILIIRIKRSGEDKAPPISQSQLPTGTEPLRLPVVTLVYKDMPRFMETSGQGSALERQSAAWRSAMLDVGQILKRSGVQRIYCLHGTFVGSDPFNILPAIKVLMPQLAPERELLISRQMKRAVDLLAGDRGNFLPSYVQLLQEALGRELPCQSWEWSSGNHHLARLEGAVRLAAELSRQQNLKLSGPILLIGHSHARQVFALLSQLISGNALGERLWKLLLGEKIVSSEEHLRTKALAGRLRLDCVTLGGPLRYPFAAIKGLRCLHLVNHRGSGEQAEQLRQAWTTAGGDYVQQWGCAGSDALATTQRERQLNRELDGILGVGIDSRLWLQTVSTRQRVGSSGRTLLVDYGDQGRFSINCLATVFGHGIYTRHKAMLFNLQCVAKYLYSE